MKKLLMIPHLMEIYLPLKKKNKGKDTNGEDSVDESYTSKKKDIKGYTFSGLSKDSAPSSGTLTDNTSDITYLYKKFQFPGEEHYCQVCGHRGQNKSLMM